MSDKPDPCSDTDPPFCIVTFAADRHSSAPMSTNYAHFYAAANIQTM